MDSAKKSILVVDDDQASSEMMRIALGQMGYEVTISQNGNDALAEASRSQFDLYLTDYRLPDLSGPELCRELKGLTPNTPFVFVTGATRQSDMEDGLQAGATAFIAKPVDLDGLEKTLSLMLES
jgi:CheY-like chemotaxis protein